MSKRQHGESSLSQPPEHPSITNSAPNNDNGLLPINDLLSSTDEQHPPAAHVKRPRHFIASVACENCRLKKTRCDESRPRCGLCKSLGLECVYNDRKSTK